MVIKKSYYEIGDKVTINLGNIELTKTISRIDPSGTIFFEKGPDSFFESGIMPEQIKPVEIVRFGKKLTNQNLKVGDEVYPISHGRSNDKDFSYRHEYFEFEEREEKYTYEGYPKNCFEREPHIILDLNHSRDCKAYEIRTSFGYGPKEKYFKIITEK